MHRFKGESWPSLTRLGWGVTAWIDPLSLLGPMGRPHYPDGGLLSPPSLPVLKGQVADNLVPGPRHQLVPPTTLPFRQAATLALGASHPSSPDLSNWLPIAFGCW